MTKRILDIVDMQNDFMMPKGALYVNGADKIIPSANAFLKGLKKGDFDFALVKFDTHFSETYSKNPESAQFPPHCIFDTWGWQMAIKLPKKISDVLPVYQMDKDVFDMWAKKEKRDADFKDQFNARANANLFKIGLLENPKQAQSRNGFMKSHKIGKDTEVVMMGVASDYCVHDAMLGYLKRGCKVTVLSDLVKGIGTDVPGRAKTGDIKDVLKLPQFAPYVEKGMLRTVTSDALMKEIRKEKKHEQKHENRTGPIKPNRR